MEFYGQNKVYAFRIKENLKVLSEKYKQGKSSYSKDRVDYIKKWLLYNKVPFNITTIIDEKERLFYNITVSFLKRDSQNKDTVIFMAHHDIVNRLSQNILDNSGSIINLLHLALLINNNRYILNKNIIICFNDDEERQNKVGTKNFINKLIEKNKIDLKRTTIFCLDVTSIGNCLLYENIDNNITSIVEKNKFVGSKLKIELPNNDAKFIRSEYMLNAICLSLLPENMVDDPESFWGKLHTEKDNINNCNHNDMCSFIYFLFNIAKF